MSESSQPQPPPHVYVQVGEEPRDEHQHDALPVLAATVSVAPAQPAAAALPAERRPVIPAVQAAAVAAGGFVAGAAIVGLAHRRQRRSALLAGGRRTRRGANRTSGSGRGSSRAAELVQIVGSRSLLVDVHLLGRPGER